MAQSNPATPARGNWTAASNAAFSDPGREHAARLNRIYNLGLYEQLLDGLMTMSPAAKDKRAQNDPRFRRHNDIVNLLRFHNFKGKYRLLAILDVFDKRAREQSAYWVCKPLANRDLLPRSDSPPRAQTVEDQVSLQELLLETLTKAKESISGRSAYYPTSQTQLETPKTAPPASPTPTALPAPVPFKVEDTPIHGTPQVQSRRLSLSSSFSTRSSAMFSARDAFEDQFDSQNTADTSESDFVRDLRHTSSSESFAISNSSLDVLNETLNNYEESITEIPVSPDSPTSSSLSGYASEPGIDIVPDLKDRLDSVFPLTPAWLRPAPFPIVWEMTRIAMHCGVDLNGIGLEYSPQWLNQDAFRREIARHPSFSGMLLPEQSSQLSWDTALQRQASSKAEFAPVYVIEMNYNLSSSGPLYFVKLKSLNTNWSHRLSRHFGADRFIELLFPVHHSDPKVVPHILRNHEAAVYEVNRWLTSHHSIFGRTWTTFFTKDVKRVRKAQSDTLEKAPESAIQKRVFLFCEDGPDFLSTTGDGICHTTPIRVHEMIDWLLQYTKFPQNLDQPYLKLFSRIALGLSRTFSTVVFEPESICHHNKDLLSPTNKVMNDGIGRMSLSVARKLRVELGLSDLPTAVQGRLGSAKGMWILDPEDRGIEDWIETYPSQRKWICDFTDVDQRTLEVRNYASEVRSSGLNKQFLSVLEDRSVDKARMRSVLGSIFKGGLCRDLEDQKAALDHPLLFSAWISANSRQTDERAAHCQVQFLGGLPDNDEEMMQFLLSGGFDPRAQKFLWGKTYMMQKQNCDKLKEKLNVRVGRTAYLLMVIDFYGVLEEGEVQVCFSSKFQVDADDPDANGDDGSFSDTMLIDTDILVARSPAHFASDIQKVKAVFRKELCALKDVIVFSSKGNSPLADKLSGGDYDGDMAWVCWDPRIVDNFENAPEPVQYDLIKMGYMQKVETTVTDLAKEVRATPRTNTTAAINEMIRRGFEFNMKDNLLGKLTVYKEDLCYWRGIIDDRTAEILSTLLSNLVDQAKQGILFTKEDFERLRKEQLEGMKHTPPPARLYTPAYKKSTWPKGKVPTNFLDYLKFAVAKPIIQKELKALDEFGKHGNEGEGPTDWDPDLVRPAKEFELLAKESVTCRAILDALKSDIQELYEAWNDGVRKWRMRSKLAKDAYDDPGYRQRILDVYQQWCEIDIRLPNMSSGSESPATTVVMTTPTRQGAAAAAAARRNGGGTATVLSSLKQLAAVEDKTIPALLQQEYLVDGEHSQWAILRASQTYRMFYKRREFVWQLAGRQLQAIKAMMTHSHGQGGGLGGSNVVMTPLHYAASRPDTKMVRRMVARLRGMEEEAGDYDYRNIDDE